MNEGIKGLWRLFGPTTEPVLGTLTGDSGEDVKLQVEIPVHQMPQVVARAFTLQLSCPQVLHGEEQGGRAVTLLGCNLARWNVAGGVGTFEVHPLVVLRGASIESWEHTRFSGVKFRLTLLDHWLNRNQIAFTPGGSFGVQLQIQNHDDICVELADKSRVKIAPDFQLKSEIGEGSIQVHHAIEIRLPHPVGPSVIISDYIEVFRRLLMFCTSVEAFAEDIEFLLPDESEKWVEFLSPNPGVTNAIRTRSQRRLTLGFRELGQDFSEFLNVWFGYNKRLSSVLSLYFGCIHNRTLYDTQRFLFLAQALEVYHRNHESFNGLEQDDKQWAARLERILNSVVPDEKEWLKGRLAFANEKTLSTRLKELLDAHSSDITDVIPDPNEFRALVRDSRNAYTHYSATRRKNVAEGVQLHRLCWQMQTFLCLCILKDLKISGDPINRLIDRYRSARFISTDADTE